MVAGLRCSGPDSTGWCWQAPQPWGHLLRDVVFLDTRRGWALGDGGALLRTDDGGATWQERFMPGSESLRALRMVDSNRGWLLGLDGGRLWHTRDAGVTWTPQPPLPVDRATGMALQDNGTLLVNGLRHDAAGEPVTLLADTADLVWRRSASFVYPELAERNGTLWGLADGRFVESLDGGRSFAPPAAWAGMPYRPVPTDAGQTTAWLSLYDPPSTHFGKLALQRRPPDRAWSALPLPPVPADQALWDMAVFSTGGWASSAGGPAPTATLWRLDPGSDAWRAADLPGPEPDANGTRVQSWGFVDGVTAWMQPVDLPPRFSDDGARSWHLGAGLPAGPEDRVRFVRRDGAGGLLLGYGGDDYLDATPRWFRSTDGGRQWRALPGTAADGDAITGLWWLDGERGLATTSGGRWLDTDDAGRHWHERAASTRLPGALADLQFTPDGSGWVLVRTEQPPVGLGGPRPSPVGVVYRSSDRGRNWEPFRLPEGLAGRVQWWRFVDERHVFASAATGCISIRGFVCYERLYRSADAGLSWEALPFERPSWTRVFMRSPSDGVDVNGLGVSLTTDGGRNWSDRIAVAGDGRALVPQKVLASAGRLWLLSSDRLFSSTDGGRRWQESTLPLPAGRVPDGLSAEPLLLDIGFADALNGWIVGREGLVLATQDGGGTWAAQSSGTRQVLQVLHVRDARRVWIGGQARSILATASGGG